jgi:dimeric dUTPase (all-alpha-NTP-PPase superfamily)
MQRELDERIIRDKGLEGQDLLPMKILALQVELGELENEWRGFKFWSKDQSPRYEKRSIAFADPGGPFEHITHPLLEEYVDSLHFILSIGLEIGKKRLLDFDFPTFGSKSNAEIIESFSKIIALASYLNEDDHLNVITYYQQMIWKFTDLGYMLGFTWEQIEAAYIAKNHVNHERQANGY